MTLPTPTLLISRLAPRTFIGLDLLSFTSTPNFHGVRDIIPGAHFLYSGTSESFSLRSGEWIFIRNGEGITQEKQGTQLVLASQRGAPDIRLRHWNPESETLRSFDKESAEELQEALRLRANLGQILQSGGLLSYEDAISGPHRKNKGHDTASDLKSADWVRLSDHISPSTLTRILGEPLIDSDGNPQWMLSSGSSAIQDAEDIPGLSESEAAKDFGRHDKELGFLPIDFKQTWREGAIGRERTEAAQDRSWYLGSLIERLATNQQNEHDNKGLTTGERELLGEMQFTFLMTLTLMNYSCMEQWKRILRLIFSCRKAFVRRERFFIEAIRLLVLQIRHFDDVEGGLLEFGNDDGKFLKKLLTSFVRLVEETDSENTLGVKSEADNMRRHVEELLGWELRSQFTVRRGMLQLEDGEQVEMDVSDAEEDEETGEYAPVIVDPQDTNMK
ncbi:hypothetical protein KEM54_006206 [Ascosphaera aggregata]|nr:hypothetical protein KEM54_006206 [Ascosphaera aggregata]